MPRISDTTQPQPEVGDFVRAFDLGQVVALKKKYCPDFDHVQTARELKEKAAKLDAETRSKIIDGRIRKTGVPMKYRDAVCSAPWSWDWAESSSPGLYIWGDTGVGKTYEASAIIQRQARLWAASQPSLHIGVVGKSFMAYRFTTLSAILDQTRASGTTRDEVLERYNRFEMLCLDDLGKEKGSDYTLETLYRLIDLRLANGLRTIITSNMNPVELVNVLNPDDSGKMVADAILDRMRQYTVVEYCGESRR